MTIKDKFSMHSIVDWDLYHKINKTSEKTLKELRKLLNDPKNKISDTGQNDGEIDNHKKIKK